VCHSAMNAVVYTAVIAVSEHCLYLVEVKKVGVFMCVL